MYITQRFDTHQAAEHMTFQASVHLAEPDSQVLNKTGLLNTPRIHH